MPPKSANKAKAAPNIKTAEQLEKCFHRLRKAADEGVLLPLKPDIAGQYRTSADNFRKTSLQNKRF